MPGWFNRPHHDRAFSGDEAIVSLLHRADASAEAEDWQASLEYADHVLDLLAGASSSAAPGTLELAEACARLYRGTGLAELGRLDESDSELERITRQFGEAQDPTTLSYVAGALSWRARVASEKREYGRALELYDEAVARFLHSTDQDTNEHIASALAHRGYLLSTTGDLNEAIKTYDLVMGRFGTSTDARIQVDVASSLFNRASSYEQLGEAARARADFADLVLRYTDTDDRRIEEIVRQAEDRQRALA